MKGFLRSIVYSLLALFSSQLLFNSLDFGVYKFKSFILILLGLALLQLLARTALKIVSLPSKGFGYFFLDFVLVLIVFFCFTVIIPDFGFRSSSFYKLPILKVMLTSSGFNPIWSGIFSAIVFTFVFNFFEWLAKK